MSEIELPNVVSVFGSPEFGMGIINAVDHIDESL